ncbi:hypothetical protein ABZ641_38805, partial [Kitasatospora sp. NPDC007106]
DRRRISCCRRLPRLPAHQSAATGHRRRRCALIGERRLVLADEPTGALDSATGDAVLEVLRGRCDAGAAAVMVTHDPAHAAWADRVVFLRDGQITDESVQPRIEAVR